MKLKPIYIVILLFLFSFLFRLYFGLQSEYFFGGDSYFHVRIIDNYIEDGGFLTYDQLSFSGKYLNYPQLFHFLISLFSFAPNYLEIISSLMTSSLVVIMYFICLRLTKNETASIFAALLTVFLPTELKLTLNQISPLHLFLPLMFLMIYCFMRIEDKKFFNLFLILSFLLPLIHPLS